MHDWNDVSTWIILLVDDEIDNLEVVAETLQFFGAKVKTADNGQAALELLKTFAPTLIITDLSMPGMDGWQMRVKIKGLPEWKAIPIIALSAHAMAGDKERALSAGFDGYLTKPIDVHTLITDVRAALKHHEIAVAAKPVVPDVPLATTADTQPQVIQQESEIKPPATGPAPSTSISTTSTESPNSEPKAAQAPKIEAVVSMSMLAERAPHE